MASPATVQPITLIHNKANIYPHTSSVTREQRNKRNNHRSGIVWLTGLSGAGKSTIAAAVEQQLFEEGFLVSMLDGDTLRSGLNSDLDFSTRSREENLRRAAEVASLFAENGHIVIASFISPHAKGRDMVKNLVRDNFYLTYVHAALDDCLMRDPKGLYKKALAGGIENFTGIGQSYQTPETPDLIIDTSANDITASSKQLYEFIIEKFLM